MSLSTILGIAVTGYYSGPPVSDAEVAHRFASRVRRRETNGPSRMAQTFATVSSPFRALRDFLDHNLNGALTKVFQGIDGSGSASDRALGMRETASVQVRRFCNDTFAKIEQGRLKEIPPEDFGAFRTLVQDNARNWLSWSNYNKYISSEYDFLRQENPVPDHDPGDPNPQ